MNTYQKILSSKYPFVDIHQPISFSLVGSSGFEPPTSRLSGVRSNHLSYRPVSLRLFSSSISQGSLLDGGDEGIRTLDPLLAGQVLSQLSYTPISTGSQPNGHPKLNNRLRLAFCRDFCFFRLTTQNRFRHSAWSP